MKREASELLSPRMMLFLLNTKRKWFNSIALLGSLLLLTQTRGFQKYYRSVLYSIVHSPRALLPTNDSNATIINSDKIETCPVDPSKIRMMEDYEYELNESPPLLPIGLANLRNTCYLNSVLQSLYLIQQYSRPILREYWRFNKNSFGVELFKLFSEMQQKAVERESTSSKYRSGSVIPIGVAKHLKININEQEDAEEIFLKILNQVDDSLPAVAAANKTGGKKKSNSIVSSLRPSDVFSCELQQLIHLVDHEDELSSNKTLRYLDFSLSIDPHAQTLSDCLKKFFEPEFLVGDNQFRCQRRGLSDARKSLRISRFPRVLALHLKRFSFDEATFQFKKITKPIDIPVRLDLSPFALKPGEQAAIARLPAEQRDAQPQAEASNLSDRTGNLGRYSLAAAVIHEGSLDRGHYFALTRVGKRGPEVDEEADGASLWVKLNDQTVTPIDEESVLRIARGQERPGTAGPGGQSIYEKFMGADPVSSNAYLLFYRLDE
jgi:ubiquitin C-terminal hydrolase